MTSTGWVLLARICGVWSAWSMIYQDWAGAFVVALAGVAFFAIARSVEA